jgi:hypothetical protein
MESAETITATDEEIEELREHPDDYPDVEWCARCEVQVAVDGDELCAFCSYDY